MIQFLVRVCAKLSQIIASWWGKRLLKSLHVMFGDRLVLYGVPIITVELGSSMQLGSDVVLCSLSSNTPLGVSHPVILRAERGGSLLIGDHVGMSGTCICAQKRIVIGARCLLGANTMIVDTDFHPLAAGNRRYGTANVQTADVILGENVFLGANSIVLKGVSIGDNSIIGAGSVVTRSIPPNSIAAGNPCRVLRSLGSSEANRLPTKAGQRSG